MAGIVDDEDVARRSGLDHVPHLEIFRPEVPPFSGELPHRDGATDAPRAWHDLRQPAHDAAKADIIERIGDGRRRQDRVLPEKVIGTAHAARTPLLNAPRRARLSYRLGAPGTTAAQRGRIARVRCLYKAP